MEIAAGAEAKVTGEHLLASVRMVRDSRDHPEIRTGSSVRGAIDHVLLCVELARLRGTDSGDGSVTLDAALLALSGRLRLREGHTGTAEQLVEELWARWFGPTGPRTDLRGDVTGGISGKSLTPPPGGVGRPGEDPVQRGRRGPRSRRRCRSAHQLAARPRPTRPLRAGQPRGGGAGRGCVPGGVRGGTRRRALAMLAELTGATDPALRELARRLAGRIVVDTARLGLAAPARHRPAARGCRSARPRATSTSTRRWRPSPPVRPGAHPATPGGSSCRPGGDRPPPCACWWTAPARWRATGWRLPRWPLPPWWSGHRWTAPWCASRTGRWW